MVSRQLLGALLVAVSLGVAGPVAGQGAIPPGSQPPVAPTGSTVEGQDVEGRITAVNPAERTVRLDNGSEYAIPDSAGVDWRNLRDGATVKLRYNTNEGRNTVTSLQILFR